MDAAPTYDFWWRFAAVLAAEVAFVAAVALGLEKLSSSGAWRRAVWHVCLVGLAVLVAVETSGLNRIVAARLTASQHVSEAIFPSPETFSLAAPERLDALEEPIVLVATPEPPAVVSPRASWWPAMLWLAGFGSVFLWSVFVSALFTVMSRRRSLRVNKAVDERAWQIAAHLGVRGHFRVVEMGGIRAPVSFGILNRTIALPAGFGETFTASQQEVMLAHELAHVTGRDAAWHLFADFVGALLWWHPVAWWVRRRVHVATEAAADEASLAVKNGPMVLAETLVALGGTLLPQHRGALGIKAVRSDLACRVQKLMALKDGEWRGLSFHNCWLLKVGGPILLAAGTIACFTWTGSSKGTPRDEWQNSVAGRAFAALSAAAANADAERIPGLLGDAKIFFDAGKLDHAEGLCEEVLKLDPANSEALQMIDAMAKARKASETMVNNSGAKPTEMERVLPPDAAGARNQFVHPQTIGSFEHAIFNALMFSTEERKGRVRLMERTSESNIVYSGTGRQRIYKLLEKIRFPSVMYDNVSLREVLSRLRDEVRQRDPEDKGLDFLLSAETPLPSIDPETGRLPVGTSEVFRRLESRTIRIVPGLQNVTLGMTLDAICKVAEPPLYHSITEYAVVFLPTVKETPLYTRTYKVDLKTMEAHFDKVMAAKPEEMHPSENESGELALYFRLKEWLLKAGIDLTYPKSMSTSSLFGLMVRATSEDHDVIQRAIKPFLSPARQVLVEVRMVELRGDAVGIKNVTGIDVNAGAVLTDPQYRLVIRALEQAPRVDIMDGGQRAVVLDGQQARFELPGLETLGLNDAIMHVVPHIRGNDTTIILGMMLGGRETANARLRDHQTAMVPLSVVKKVYGEGVSVRVLTRMAFVTATIIDASGNRVNSEEHDGDPFEGILNLR
jgi:beta-lactamase regulating signal transducer with metallopeptidase domain